MGSRHSDSLRVGRAGDRIPVGVRTSAPVYTGPGAHPAAYTMGTRSFPGVQRPRRGVDNTPPSSAEVKERVQLHFYSTLGIRGLFYSKLYLLPFLTTAYITVQLSVNRLASKAPIQQGTPQIFLTTLTLFTAPGRKLWRIAIRTLYVPSAWNTQLAVVILDGECMPLISKLRTIGTSQTAGSLTSRDSYECPFRNYCTQSSGRVVTSTLQ